MYRSELHTSRSTPALKTPAGASQPTRRPAGEVGIVSKTFRPRQSQTQTMTDRDYEDVGLVAGLEIHQQLDTETKLFCDSPTELREPAAADRRFTRYLHPTKSELGAIDEAALEESQVAREFE